MRNMKNYFLSVQSVYNNIYLAQFVQFQKISTMYITPTKGIRISRVLRGSVRSKKFKERISRGLRRHTYTLLVYMPECTFTHIQWRKHIIHFISKDIYLTKCRADIKFSCCDHSQAKAVLKFVEAISEKTLRSTVTLTAARGRGKSAALGLSLASAVAFGYVN